MSERLVNLLHPSLTPPANSPAYLAVEELGTRQLSVSRGLPSPYVHQLIEKSRQAHIVDTTPDDALKRFRCFDAFGRWSRPDREIFILHKNEDLGGVIWFTPSEDTPAPRFAVRLYEGYAGESLARPFMTITHAHIANTALAAAGVQLKVRNDNERARRLCEGFGYEAVASGAECTDMLLSSERLAEIIAAK